MSFSALLPAAEAQQLWGWALLLRSLGAQHIKTVCLCSRGTGSTPSFFKNCFAPCHGAVLAFPLASEEHGGVILQVASAQKILCRNVGAAVMWADLVTAHCWGFSACKPNSKMHRASGVVLTSL